MRRFGLLLALLAGPAAAQPAAPGQPPALRQERPSNIQPPKPPQAPLQLEPGDIWSEVKGWDREHQARMGQAAEAAKPPAPAKPAAPARRSRAAKTPPS